MFDYTDMWESAWAELTEEEKQIFITKNKNMDNKELEKEVLKTYVSNRYRSYKEAYLGGYSLSENRVKNLENRVKELEGGLKKVKENLSGWEETDTSMGIAIKNIDQLLTNK